ncbi:MULTISPECIES: helix-turn-helix domain-containing protein [Phascolarctobacterium]|jgi:HTH-type transcriptional regulator/antitoxin HipB|uniref:helix-turn-helix domain-containing protein n=1 Tax=Phascolarctobacterium TaxID=33024 RepID=UPI001B33E7A9|nr:MULTISPECIES: helix-turn-helix domain-containing protein [Phascolarctobacterium]MBS5426475.1 helix-turn-helix transcriptional regulator [Phascolarctobacterium succinatutens]MEE0509265.1 helix-turn-helix domain-containing protein [Phascolarctobacterium succinatutens]QTV77596.1 helix-turn-helix transcriptional regulator [Phascolarctobacterium sp. Marseille-Q4147]
MKILDVISLGSAIKERRKELNYTQKFLSEVTGLSSSFISDLEHGKETTEIGKVLFLINTLGLNFILEKRG